MRCPKRSMFASGTGEALSIAPSRSFSLCMAKTGSSPYMSCARAQPRATDPGRIVRDRRHRPPEARKLPSRNHRLAISLPAGLVLFSATGRALLLFHIASKERTQAAIKGPIDQWQSRKKPWFSGGRNGAAMIVLAQPLARARPKEASGRDVAVMVHTGYLTRTRKPCSATAIKLHPSQVASRAGVGNSLRSRHDTYHSPLCPINCHKANNSHSVNRYVLLRRPYAV
jgi:hypothetical protein